MPARILLGNVDTADKVVQIERKTSRVGGSAPSDIVFNGLPTHAFTLDYQEGSYWVQNTGNETLYLDENVIHCRHQMVWEQGETLQYGKSHKLNLVIHDDPSPKPLSKTLFGFRPNSLLTPEELADRQRLVKLSTILTVCILGILFFAYQIVFTSNDPDRSARRKFDGIVVALEKEQKGMGRLLDKPERRDLKNLINALKKARIAELENNDDRALMLYNAIRNQIRDQGSLHGLQIDSQFEAIDAYVWQRLQNLSDGA